MNRLGIDVGGTFTDLAHVDAAGRVAIEKVLTTPADPGQAILAGSASLLATRGQGMRDLDQAVHGTTLIANALIQRTGARVGFVTTRGFIDSLTIAEENRYDLYDLFFERPEPLVPRRLRFGLGERTTADGTRISALAGRAGHGLGLERTEPPSVALWDTTVIRPGMVLTIEPGIATEDGLYHHEQDVLVTEDGCELLTTAPTDLATIAT